MADNDRQASATEDFESEVGGEVAQPDFDHLAGIITDGFIGAVGGLVGTAAMSIGLFIAATLGVFELTSFSMLASLTGLESIFPAESLALGYLIFLGGGMFIWPLLFASTAAYLPGDSWAIKGIPYGFVLWTGFVLAFADGVDGGMIPIAGYALLTLLSHFAYGFSLGSVFDYLSERPDTLV